MPTLKQSTHARKAVGPVAHFVRRLAGLVVLHAFAYLKEHKDSRAGVK
jgi:hypothetical protein